MDRGFPGVAELSAVTGDVFGTGRRLAAVARLRGGSKKGVYRLTFSDMSTAVAYIWGPAEDYWADDAGPAQGPFAHASAAALFQASHACLDQAGVPVPRLYALDQTRQRYPADIALVADAPGGTLEAMLARDPEAAAPVLSRLRAALRVMAGCRRAEVAKIAEIAAGRGSHGSCPDILAARARTDLEFAAGREPAIAAGRRALESRLDALACLEPRASHPLIHGELGPDHVLITASGDPVIIDIEGLMHFDLEWEHAFLKLRFGAHYPALCPPQTTLDQARLRLYELAMHISLVAGPLRLLDGDFPDREPMLAIVRYNMAAALHAIR